MRVVPCDPSAGTTDIIHGISRANLVNCSSGAANPGALCTRDVNQHRLKGDQTDLSHQAGCNLRLGLVNTCPLATRRRRTPIGPPARSAGWWVKAPNSIVKLHTYPAGTLRTFLILVTPISIRLINSLTYRECNLSKLHLLYRFNFDNNPFVREHIGEWIFNKKVEAPEYPFNSSNYNMLAWATLF